MLIGYTILIIIMLVQALFYMLRDCALSRYIFMLGSYLDVMLLAALRSPTFVADEMNYLNIFWGRTSCYFELGLCKLNQIIRLFGTQTYLYFGVLAFCIFTPIWIFISKYSRNVLISVLSFVCLMYVFNAVNIVRQFLALSVILMGFTFVIKRKLWPYLGCVLMGVFFHRSAILCISLYWIYSIKASVKNVGLLLLGSFLIFIVFGQLADIYVSLDIAYSRYLSTAAQQTHLAGIIRFILNLIIMCAALICLKFTPPSQLNKAKIKIEFLTLCSCISTSAALLSLHAYNAERLAYYFYIFNIITLPEILVNITNKFLRCIIYSLTGLCLFTYGFIVLWSWQQKGLNYSFLWNSHF